MRYQLKGFYFQYSVPVTSLLRLLTFCVCFAWTGANAVNYSLKTWTTDEGLPQQTVTAIVERSDGYLWLGTFNGLARFDGINFTVFDSVNTPELASDWIEDILEDSNGYLWIGTLAGVVREKDGKFTNFPLSTPAEFAKIYCIIEKSPGVIMASSNRGLFEIEGETTKKIAPPIPDWPVRWAWIALYSNGKLLESDVTNLFEINGDQPTLIGHFSSNIYSISPTRDQAAWIGLDDRSIIRRAADGTSEHFPALPFRTSTVYLDENDNIWIGSRGGGVFLWKDGQIKPAPITSGKFGQRILPITGDRRGNIWIGTDGDGLQRLQPTPMEIFGLEEGLANLDTVAILETKKGELWAGSFDGGISVGNHGKWTPYAIPIPDFPTNEVNVSSLLETHDGSLWVGLFDGGLVRISDGRWEANEHFNKMAIRTLFEDSKSNLWVGTDLNGLSRLNKSGIKRWRDGEGLSNNTIRGITETSNGDIWVGTARGLNRIHNDKITRYYVEDGLVANFINSILADKNDDIWIATAGGGLSRYRNGKFATVNSSRGLFSDKVTELIEDDLGNLWMGSDRGIFKIDKKLLNRVMDNESPSVSCTVFGKSSGLKQPGCAGGFQPSCMRAKDGKLWFCTSGGLVAIDATKLSTNTLPPRTYLEAVVIDGQTMTAKNNGSIEIPPGLHRIEFHYTGIDLSSPGQVSFKYRLAGYDDWQDVANQRIAHYRQVPPGKYEFQVMAANNVGIWNQQPAVMTVTFQPHYWQTIWFRGAIALIISAIFYLVYRIRTEGKRQVEEMRQRIARDLHDEVGSNLGNIALLSQLASRKAEIKELLEIRSVAVQTVNAVRDVTWFINPRFDTAGDMSRHFEAVARRMLPCHQIHFLAEVPKPDETLSVGFRRNVLFIFKEMLHNVIKHAQARQVEIILETRGGKLALSVRDNGVGYKSSDAPMSGSGSGLLSMKTRAHDLRGALIVDTSPGGGTLVTLLAPMA